MSVQKKTDIDYLGESIMPTEGRDTKIIKICDSCKKKYHPRKNSYQATSRFCSAACSRRGMRGFFK